MYLSVLETQEDKDKFEKLYKKYKNTMFKVAYCVLHNKDSAEDAVHDALLCIANNFEKIGILNGQDLYANCVIIVRNAAINIFRENEKDSKNTEPLNDSKASVETNFFEKYDLDALKDSIGELPIIYQDIIYLYYVQGYSTKEICKMLGISSGAVWKRVERARKLLKQVLVEKE